MKLKIGCLDVFMLLLQAFLIILKVFGAINWSWAVVLAPLLFGVVALAVVVVIAIIIALLN